MRIEIDQKSGFCFGVVRAIEIAERTLEEQGAALSLGDIVHNGPEVARLEGKGLSTINHSQMAGSGQTVIIRAHGEPPTTYTMANEAGVTLVDATCPVVAKLQEHVRNAYKKMQEVGGTVVILGKKGHAEVVGLTGQIAENAVVVEKLEDVDSIDFQQPIYFLSQTTQSLEFFDTVKNILIEKAQSPEQVYIHDTICRQVSGRNPHLKNFATQYDVIIFVSGRKSSNGRALFDACKSVNPRSYMVENPSELQKQWFINDDNSQAQSVGICGATSTPRWQMERIKVVIEESFNG